MSRLCSTWRLVGQAGRLLRFGLVGASGTLVNFGLLLVLVERLRLAPTPAAALATESAILTNFLLNDRWTFRSDRPRFGRLGRAGRYNLVALGGLLISVGILAALTGRLGWHYLPANLVGVGAATAWNYLAGSRFAWVPAADGG